MAMTRNTRIKQEMQAHHYNCPKVTVRGAPAPTMRLSTKNQFAEGTQILECPKCHTEIAVRTIQDVGR